MEATKQMFRCMACGHEYEEQVREDEDKERGCPRCRSNSVRQLKSRSRGAKE